MDLKTKALNPSLEEKKYAVLNAVFGHDAFRPGQEQIVNALLRDESVLAVMPTGAGKSLCYQVPALVRGGVTIVVSPLVALMEDQVAALRFTGIAADTINGSRDRDTNVDTWRKVAAGDIAILYLAPERLMTERMLAALKKLQVTLFAIDEAHCLSQWGPAFRPEYAALSNLSQHFPDVPIAALTATADKATRMDVSTHLFPGPHHVFVSGFDRPNIRIAVSAKQKWKDQLIDFLEERNGQSGIVYCLSRKKTEEVARLLNDNGFSALAYHAGLSASERAENQNRFFTEDGLVITATIAFGMGIDKPDVRFVCHTDLPASIEAYYQEIGRAGRDGLPSDALMLFGVGDIRLRRQFIEDEDTDEARKRQSHQRLDALLAFADATSCRRQALLAYFGEEAEPCGNCDICDNPTALRDATEDALDIFNVIHETGHLYGEAHILDVLTGKNTEKTRKTGHDRLDVFGSGERHSRRAWQALIRQLIAAAYLEKDISRYGSLQITEKGNALSRSEMKFFCHDAPMAMKATRLERHKPAEPIAELSEDDKHLFLALKKERLELAKARKVPAFVILHDKVLHDIALARPQSLEALAKIKGIGRSKLTEFGQEIVDVVVRN